MIEQLQAKTNLNTMIRRSTREMAERHSNRLKLAQQLTEAIPATSPGFHTNVVDAPVRQEPPAHQEQAVNNGALKEAKRVLREAGINTVHLFPKTVRVASSTQGLRTNLIRSAQIKLLAQIPFATGTEVQNREFDVNMSLDNGAYSVDSLQAGEETFPVKKASIEKILAKKQEVKKKERLK